MPIPLRIAVRGVDMSVRVLLLLMVFHAPSALAAEADPLQSVMWEYHHKGLLNSEP